jgi:hypothetical protein
MGEGGLTLYGAYHFANRVFPLRSASGQLRHVIAVNLGKRDTYWRFWIRINESTIALSVASQVRRGEG